jgi:hypothetical protein
MSLSLLCLQGTCEASKLLTVWADRSSLKFRHTCCLPGVQEEPEGILRPRKLLGRDKNEAPQGIADLLPEWMGYGALYAVSAAPIVIGVGVVVILFVNSLK